MRPQRGQIRQLALGQKLLGQSVIESVQAKDDDAFNAAVRQRPAPKKGPPEQTDRPKEDQHDGGEQCREDGEKGTRQGETGTRADIGVGRRWEQEDESEKEQEHCEALPNTLGRLQSKVSTRIPLSPVLGGEGQG